jgi:hypothetical protein
MDFPCSKKACGLTTQRLQLALVTYDMEFGNLKLGFWVIKLVEIAIFGNLLNCDRHFRKFVKLRLLFSEI